MTIGEQARWWGVALVIFVIVFWTLSSVATPFLAGMAIAYFLDPVADRLERAGFSRVASTALISVVAAGVALTAAVVLIPVLIDQVNQLVRAAPDYLAALQDFIEQRGASYAPGALGEKGVLAHAFDEFETRANEWSMKLISTAAASGLALIEIVALLVITPVVAFYMLLDWDRMIAEIDRLLPRRQADEIRRIAADIDKVMAGFVRGQLTVCFILGGFYAIALAILDLRFGLVVGIFAGLISFIPYIGSLLGGAASIGIAAFQYWDDPMWIAAVAAVFLIGQAVEGNVLTPKLVGSSVGLHPVWLMFALSAFGSAMGFSGMLIAVPMAAVIGVLVRYGIAQYKSGRLYQDATAEYEDADR